MAVVSLAACGTIKKAALNNVATTLSQTGDVFTRDDDPELVRDALPFALKLYESLLESVPKNQDLLVATCSAFTRVRRTRSSRPTRTSSARRTTTSRKRCNERALKLYLRAKGYCMRAMEVRFPGIATKQLMLNPAPSLAKATKKDVPLLYWTAASWGAAISLGVDKPELVDRHADGPRARRTRARARRDVEQRRDPRDDDLARQPARGARRQPGARARSTSRARSRSRKVTSPGPVRRARARRLGAGAGSRGVRRSCSTQALAIDPEKDPSNRLVTLITQRRAQALLDQVDTMFIK